MWKSPAGLPRPPPAAVTTPSDPPEKGLNVMRTGEDGGPYRPRRYRGWAMIATFLLAASALVAFPSPARAATAITINGSSGGRVFDGVGAISGGGGNSRLLIDYPEPQRGQILDYLFSPGYGAALQILKVEIGGDTNSTSGSEPSHAHFRGDLNCDRGYEWWIMEQAKARNPAIKLAALAWGAPGWLGNGTFISTDTINYLIDWLGCARQHNLTIDYLSASQNERKYDANWTINLRRPQLQRLPSREDHFRGRLPGTAAQQHPRLPVQARVRRGDADHEGGDRWGHQLDLRRGAEP